MHIIYSLGTHTFGVPRLNYVLPMERMNHIFFFNLLSIDFYPINGHYWPARESRRSLNTAFGFLCMEKCSISAERSLVSLNMTCRPSLVSLTMTCGPYLNSSNIFISDAC